MKVNVKLLTPVENSITLASGAEHKIKGSNREIN